LNKSDISRDFFMLKGSLARRGYDWWWHNFTAYNRQTGEAKTFFIEYFVCNPKLGGNQPVLGQLPMNREKNIKPSYALVKVGAWGKDAKQIHNFYPISDFSCEPKSMNLKIGKCILSEIYMKGECNVTTKEALEHPEYMCDGGKMSWDIRINKKIAYNVGYGSSKFFRKINAFEMFWHAEGIKTKYSGIVTLDGITYDVIEDKSFGYADKNWGKDFTSPWLWISSCNMKSLITGERLNNSVVEAGGGRPKILGIALDRKILIGMFYEGKMYEYNFSKIFTRSRVKFEFFEGKNFNVWNINASNKNSEIELILKCPKDEMLLINYEAPNGKKLHNKLWNGGTGFGEIKLFEKRGKENILIDHIEIKNTGCEYGEYGEYK
jgi:tocopherol cyclase